MSNLEGKSHSFFTLDAESLWRKHHSLKSTEFRLKVEKRSRRKSMETLLDELGWMTMEDNSSSANTSSSERGYTSVEPAMSNYTIRVDTPSDEERHTSRPVTSEESDYDSDGSAQIESRSSTSLSINVDPSAHTVAWASQSVHHRALVPLEGNLRRKTRETAVPVSLNNRRGVCIVGGVLYCGGRTSAYVCEPDSEGLLQAGDLVTSWNGQDLTEMSFEDVLKFTSSQPITECMLDVVRSPHRREVYDELKRSVREEKEKVFKDRKVSKMSPDLPEDVNKSEKSRKKSNSSVVHLAKNSFRTSYKLLWKPSLSRLNPDWINKNGCIQISLRFDANQFDANRGYLTVEILRVVLEVPLSPMATRGEQVPFQVLANLHFYPSPPCSLSVEGDATTLVNVMPGGEAVWNFCSTAYDMILDELVNTDINIIVWEYTSEGCKFIGELQLLLSDTTLVDLGGQPLWYPLGEHNPNLGPLPEAFLATDKTWTLLGKVQSRVRSTLEVVRRTFSEKTASSKHLSPSNSYVNGHPAKRGKEIRLLDLPYLTEPSTSHCERKTNSTSETTTKHSPTVLLSPEPRPQGWVSPFKVSHNRRELANESTSTTISEVDSVFHDSPTVDDVFQNDNHNNQKPPLINYTPGHHDTRGQSLGVCRIASVGDLLEKKKKTASTNGSNRSGTYPSLSLKNMRREYLTSGGEKLGKRGFLRKIQKHFPQRDCERGGGDDVVKKGVVKEALKDSMLSP